MGSVAEAKRAYFKGVTGSTQNAVADLEAEYYEKAKAGTVSPVAPATTAVNGTVKQAAFIAQVTVPFADLTAAATAHNALLTALKTAGVMKPTV